MRIKLKQIIESKGYKQQQVAEALGFHKTTLYNHVRGDNILGIIKARKVAALLGITVEEVYCED